MNDKVLVTGAAGFIGSHLCEYLIKKQYQVIGLDNFATGFAENVSFLRKNPNFSLIKGDIRSLQDCIEASKGCKYILHQAALGSVPRSVEDPITTNDVNISGFLNVLQAGKINRVERIVYAASSSTYGDSKALPKTEDNIGKPLSPYAVTKLVNELYADVFHKVYGIDLIGLRYFNVFGARQNPNGAYAAVIPLFVTAALEGKSPIIHGDGSQTRDFTYIENVVQANHLAMTSKNSNALNQVYNVAYGDRTSLIQLWDYIVEITDSKAVPTFSEARAGDVKDSLADISKAKQLLGYEPQIGLKKGLANTIEWYRADAKKNL
jgi:UDP-N-acetylglucosamine 4-epimerase